MDSRDRALLEKIQLCFGVGKVYDCQGSSSYRVESLQELTVIINHFDQFPLLTQKRADFELFKEIVELMNRKVHRTPEGIQQIVNIKASMNNGLSDKLKEVFPNTIPIARPLIELPENIESQWLVGFVDGDGTFGVEKTKSSTHRLGTKVKLRFAISQHTRDAELLQLFVGVFGCGRYFSREGCSVGEFRVDKNSEIFKYIIPFFDKYSLIGVKSLDYADFKKVAEIIKVGGHLTEQGLEDILKIKAGMNRGRSHSAD